METDAFVSGAETHHMEVDVDMKEIDHSADSMVVADSPNEEKSRDLLELIQDISRYLCSVEQDGEELAAGFQRIPNRRILPDYFHIIDKPVAFSTIRGKIQKKQYTSFADFVRDVAQICHNAQVYNRPSAPIFGAAERLREVFKEELQKLEANGEISPQNARLPDLGELPSAEESPSRGSEAEDPIHNSEGGDLDEDDELEEEEEGDDDDDGDENQEDGKDVGGRRRKPYQNFIVSGLPSRDGQIDEDSPRKRGQTANALTPLDGRILSIINGLTKTKDGDGNLLIEAFEKLPDKSVAPDYYETISKPMALDHIRKQAKSKNYSSVDHMMLDLNSMFDNAKLYNADDTDVYRAAAELQLEARVLAEQEKAKPDYDFRDEDGNLALAEILHHDQTWRIGDWVHIRNPNDLAKPIVAQIFRMWQDRDDQKWINACWYFRPEQTVHRYEKHFFEHEVVKTDQYRDHRIGEVIDHCFVMFITRFHKGRPRGFPPDKDVYVCESRYHEESFRFKKIKKWAGCVPDEVRDRDYEMDLFEIPRQLRKVPSPIKHLLREDAKETDLMPKPTWGSSNAPPIVGAVHRRPPEPNESPPPMSTPLPHSGTLVPGVPLESSHRALMMLTARDGITKFPEREAQGSFSMTGAAPSSSHHHAHLNPAQIPHLPQNHQTPVPIPHPSQQATQPQVIRPLQHQHPHHQAVYPQSYLASYAKTAAMPLHTQPTAISRAASYSQGHQASNSRPSNVATPGVSQAHTNINNPPRPHEVYTLLEDANDALPIGVRQKFQHDSNGKVLFFAAAPLDRSLQGLSPAGVGQGHSITYLAGRDAWLTERKRKLEERHGLTNDLCDQEKGHQVSDGSPDTAATSGATQLVEDWFQHLRGETDRWEKSVGLTGWKNFCKRGRIS